MGRSLDRRGESGRSDGGRGRGSSHRYPRTARINALLAEVLADSLERLVDDDERLGLLTVTGVRTDADLRHATVFFSSLTPEVAAVLGEHRLTLQAAIGRGVRMKRTPLLQFLPDPAIAAGARVEELLRRIEHRDE
jgi:ribosome-binding factor A